MSKIGLVGYKGIGVTSKFSGGDSNRVTNLLRIFRRLLALSGGGVRRQERRLRLLLPGSAIMMNLSSGGEDFDDAALDAHLATCAAARAERWAAY